MIIKTYAQDLNQGSGQNNKSESQISQQSQSTSFFDNARENLSLNSLVFDSIIWFFLLIPFAVFIYTRAKFNFGSLTTIRIGSKIGNWISYLIYFYSIAILFRPDKYKLINITTINDLYYLAIIVGFYIIVSTIVWISQFKFNLSNFRNFISIIFIYYIPVFAIYLLIELQNNIIILVLSLILAASFFFAVGKNDGFSIFLKYIMTAVIGLIIFGIIILILNFNINIFIIFKWIITVIAYLFVYNYLFVLVWNSWGFIINNNWPNMRPVQIIKSIISAIRKKD